MLKGANNQPVSDATVQLIGTDGLTIWTAKTDNSGRAELFADAFGKTNAAKMSVLYAGKTYNLDKIRKMETGANELRIPVACSFAPTIDVAFVVDATGSMGDEIAYLKAEVADVIRQVKRDNQQLNVRLGSVFYRDFNDAYLTRTFDFDKSLKKNVEFIREQSADGGGDTPEAVPEGLEAAIDSMSWSDNAGTRLLFLVLDAPPHLTDKNIEKLQRLSAKAAEKGIRIIPIAASGVDQNTEYLMKALAVATGGTYTFLTDDSGVGGEHLKATTEKHEVELLNALMIRLIKQYSIYEACNDIATEATTGGDTKLGLNFKVFPNPVRDVMNLELKTAVTNVFITNTQGQKVRNLGTYTEGSPSVDVSDLSSGIYFVHFEKDGVVCTKKISVVK
jgi:Mg-chelatase subunit ChlD